MSVGFNSENCKLFLKLHCTALSLKASKNNASDVKANCTECINKSHYVKIVGDTKIASNLVLFNICGIYGNNYLSLVTKLEKHLQFTVRRKTGKHTRRMKVVEKLAAKLKIKLAAKLFYSLFDVL